MSPGNIVIMSIMLAMVMLFPLSFLKSGRKVRVVDAYLGGANLGQNDQFRNSLSAGKDMSMQNYYLQNIFGEAKLFKWGVILAVILVIVMLGLSLRCTTD